MGCRGPDDQAMMHLSAPEHHMASMAAALQPDMHHQKQDQVCLILSSLSPFLLCSALHALHRRIPSLAADQLILPLKEVFVCVWTCPALCCGR